MASELVFEFTDPSFGGDPFYGSLLLEQAKLQNPFEEESKSFYKPKTLLERFTESFTNQLIYRMADLMLDQIFGEDNQLPEGTGSYTIGNFRIEWDATGDYYKFTITDISTGESTTIELPKYL